MKSPTPTQRLAGVLLGKPLGQWVKERRAEGRSWRLLARDLHEATNGQVDIAGETLRLWYSEAERVAS